LNFTASADAISSAIDRAEIKTAISARQFHGRLTNLPGHAISYFFDDLLPKLKGKFCFGGWREFYAQLLLAAWLGLPRQGGHKEAVLLFTSGSSGEPKGVVLFSSYLIGNVTQFTVMLDAGPEDSLLCLASLLFTVSGALSRSGSADRGHANSHLSSPLEAGKERCLVESTKSRCYWRHNFLAGVFA